MNIASRSYPNLYCDLDKHDFGLAHALRTLLPTESSPVLSHRSPSEAKQGGRTKGQRGLWRASLMEGSRAKCELKGGRKIKGRRQGYSNTSLGGTMSVGGRTLEPKLNFSH